MERSYNLAGVTQLRVITWHVRLPVRVPTQGEDGQWVLIAAVPRCLLACGAHSVTTHWRTASADESNRI